MVRRLAKAVARRRAQRRFEHLLERMLDKVEWSRLEEIKRDRYHGSEDPRGTIKYFDYEARLRDSLRRAFALRLHTRRPLRILDIGSGAGYFLFAASELGHDAIGLDSEHEMHPSNLHFGEMVEFLGQRRVVHHILKYEPLPDVRELRGPFDLVIATGICFALHNWPGKWQVDEWAFFLRDLKPRLAPTGVVHLQFNVTTGEEDPHSPELRRYFLGLGARVDRCVVAFDSAALVP